ncbi:hypothetical protein C8F04DRAFT_1266439 [Mycena alexandri]|uniref:Uncharacterized protein n=1 Tax=Mycena alexandri TaxID=1745969 RepID=A0AAD6WUR1_9AGAR|nr:hypothetical protein C8F04DRAFT_1266439 [Mycena alexandri]
MAIPIPWLFMVDQSSQMAGSPHPFPWYLLSSNGICIRSRTADRSTDFGGAFGIRRRLSEPRTPSAFIVFSAQNIALPFFASCDVSLDPQSPHPVLTMGGKSQKKRQCIRNAAYEREGRRLRHRAAVVANRFYCIPEMFGRELLPHCTLETVMVLSLISHYARNLIRAFFLANQRTLLEPFVEETNLNAFYDVLESSLSGMAGSFASSLLTPPYYTALTTDLNIFTPYGNLFIWRDFFDRLALVPVKKQTGVDRRYFHTTSNHIVYHAKTADFTISITESNDNSLFTPLIGATTTLNTTLCTAARFYSLYASLLSQRRALEAWFPTPVRKAVAIGKRRYRSSFSTASWERPCGIHCPILWRHIRGLEKVGIFTWGGYKGQHGDFSEVGIPFSDTDLKWRLGDTCSNENCPWRHGNYFAIPTE